MNNLEETLKQHIKKLVHPLKEDHELKMQCRPYCAQDKVEA